MPRLDSPPGSAAAAPDSPATRAWLSLVGMPNRQASTAQHTMAVMAAHRAARASKVLRPKSAMEKIVSETAPPAAAAHRLPSRLQAAASQAARRKGRAPDTTAEAMALGASVQPLTRMTARSSRVVASRAGLVSIPARKSRKDRGMGPPPNNSYGKLYGPRRENSTASAGRWFTASYASCFVGGLRGKNYGAHAGKSTEDIERFTA